VAIIGLCGSSSVISIYVDATSTVLSHRKSSAVDDPKGWPLVSRQLFRLAMVIVIATGCIPSCSRSITAATAATIGAAVAEYVGDRYQAGREYYPPGSRQFREVFTATMSRTSTRRQTRLSLSCTKRRNTSKPWNTRRRASGSCNRNPNEDVHRMGEMPRLQPL